MFSAKEALEEQQQQITFESNLKKKKKDPLKLSCDLSLPAEVDFDETLNYNTLYSSKSAQS